MALLLWAGANPWSRGPETIEELEDDADDKGLNAVETALMSGNISLFEKPKQLLDPANIPPGCAPALLETACHADGAALGLLLARGLTPLDLPDGGTRAIGSLLHSMSWDFSTLRPSPLGSAALRSPGIDTQRSRERMRMLHMLVAAGAKWLPSDKAAIARTRQCLLKMARPYVLEFAWLMRKYGAGRREDLVELLRTAAMTRLLAGERGRVDTLVAEAPVELEP